MTRMPITYIVLVQIPLGEIAIRSNGNNALLPTPPQQLPHPCQISGELNRKDEYTLQLVLPIIFMSLKYYLNLATMNDKTKHTDA